MVVYCYKDWNPKEDSIDRVNDCNQIIQSYMQQGFSLTLRQLYYQLVSQNIIANNEKEYKALGNLVSRARLAGMMDWDAIEDRVRRPWTPLEYENLEEMIEDAIQTYRLPRWRNQNTYAELWVEKDALAGVLQPLASAYHTTMMVNRGYSSQSAMYESAERIMNTRERMGAKNAIVFYLGDLDPSGEDMVRDIRDRLRMFECRVEVKKIALTMAQVQHFKPPPNPTKLTDSRAADFVARYGNNSWEVDALSPPTLQALIRAEFDLIVDKKLMDAIKKREKKEKKEVRQVVEQLMKGQPEEEEPESDGAYRCPNCASEYDEEWEVNGCAEEEDCPGWRDTYE